VEDQAPAQQPARGVRGLDLRGRPTGPPVQARATLLDGAQARVAAKALARRHRVLQGSLVPAAHRLLRYRTKHYELSPDPGTGHPAG
jgi:uncharacterized protein